MLAFIKGLPQILVGGVGMAIGAVTAAAILLVVYEGFWFIDGQVDRAFEAGESAAEARCRTTELEAELAEIRRQQNATTLLIEETRRRTEERNAGNAARQERVDELQVEIMAAGECPGTQRTVDRMHRAWGLGGGDGSR